MPIIEVEKIQTRRMEVRIRGLTRLVVHRFGEKALKIIEATKQGEGRTKPREKWNEKDEYRASAYSWSRNSKERYGFPVVGLKQAMISAAIRFTVDFAKKAPMLAGCVYIDGDLTGEDGRDYILLDKDSKPSCLTNYVRLAGIGRPVDLRARMQFIEWTAPVRITYDADCVSPTSLVNLLERAGQQVGIGEGRPETKAGLDWGRFTVETLQEEKSE